MDLNWWERQPWQLIPYEYKGWIFIGFLAVALIVILYGFYLIATDEKMENIPERVKGKVRK